MAWTSNVIPTQFKNDLLLAIHNFNSVGGNSFKVALYDDTITPAITDTTYNTTGELATSGGYTQGGVALTNNGVATGSGKAWIDFADASWTTSTFTANGCKIYNTTQSNKLVGEFWFGGAKSVVSGTFTIQWPTPDATNALLRLN